MCATAQSYDKINETTEMLNRCDRFQKNAKTKWRDKMNSERQKHILEKILVQKKVTVKNLASELYASEPSIRRDLADLERQNLIKRVHGGAILEETGISAMKIPFVIREMEQADAKITIARKAVEYIRDNDVIFLDASSSAYNIIPYLPLKNNITVITSGVKALAKLSEYNIKTISTGGELMPSCLSLIGDEAYHTLEHFHADVAFFSCRGLSYDGYLTDISSAENYVRQKMIDHAKQSFLLCASEKIGKTYYHNLCTMKDISGVISEVELETLPFNFT